MGPGHCKSSTAWGVLAFALAAPGLSDVAQAQFAPPVTPVGPTVLADPYTPAVSVSTVGQLGSAAGDTFIGQQLNFGAGFGAFVGPTGRLRHTDHDGLRNAATGARGSAFEVDEGSVFGSASADLPGTYWGGRVRVSGLAGYGRLEQDSVLPGGFSAEADLGIFGASVLWSSGSFYTLSQIIGLDGDADARDANGEYGFDVAGYVTNSVVGNTFDAPASWKLDLRAGLGHYDIASDRFLIPGAAETSKAGAEAWNASLTGTLFTIMNLQGGVLRPYLLGSYKHVFDEDIRTSGALAGSYEQARDFGRAEAGFDYVQGAMTYGAAGYGEFSADEETYGLKIGASVKLD